MNQKELEEEQRLRAELQLKSLSERTKSSWSLQTLARFIFIAREIYSGNTGLG